MNCFALPELTSVNPSHAAANIWHLISRNLIEMSIQKKKVFKIPGEKAASKDNFVQSGKHPLNQDCRILSSSNLGPQQDFVEPSTNLLSFDGINNRVEHWRHKQINK